MENYIGEQLTFFSAAVLLGIWEALIYDLLRAIRLRRREDRKLTHLLDALYVVTGLGTLFWFSLHFGGELRLYMLLGALLGAVLYLGGPGRLLRPVWDFWAGVGEDFLRWLWLPFRLLGKGCKKIYGNGKKYFHFQIKYATIKNYRREVSRLHPGAPRMRRHVPHEKTKEKQKAGESADSTGAGRADFGGRRQGRTGLRKTGHGPQ